MIVASHSDHHTLRPERLRAIALERRISASPPLARAIADLVYGHDRRTDLNLLAAIVASRISEARA